MAASTHQTVLFEGLPQEDYRTVAGELPETVLRRLEPVEQVALTLLLWAVTRRMAGAVTLQQKGVAETPQQVAR